MSSILLDTHVFIWMAEDDAKMPSSIKSRIEATENVFVSIVSFWEIALKSQKEQVFLGIDFNEIEARFALTRFKLLDISIQDTVQVYNLPFYLKEHRDPFDRLLISQAINRSMPLASCDKAFDAYPIEKIWA
jgi:PIN domain nuclease of toxin-antitoxin system